MKKFFMVAVVSLVLTCCDEITRTVYELETKDGGTIRLACPVIDPERHPKTYVINGDCVIYK